MSSNNKPICVNHGKWTFPILGCMSCWKGCHWAYESADIVSVEFVSTWIMRITPLKYSWGEQKSIRRLFIKTSCSISAWRPAPCIVPLDFLGMLFPPPPLRSPLLSPQVLEPTHLWLMATAAHVWAGQGPPEPCAALCPPWSSIAGAQQVHCSVQIWNLLWGKPRGVFPQNELFLSISASQLAWNGIQGWYQRSQIEYIYRCWRLGLF